MSNMSAEMKLMVLGIVAFGIYYGVGKGGFTSVASKIFNGLGDVVTNVLATV